MVKLRATIDARNGREATLLVACVATGLVFWLAAPSFGTVDNLTTVLRNSGELLFVGLGMTLLLAMGGVDVSVGTVMGLAAIAVGKTLEAGWSPLLAGLAGPLVGGAVGLLTAVVVVLGGVPAIVGTLGLLGIYRAAIFLVLGGTWLSGLPSGLTDALSPRPFGIPLVIGLIAIAYGLVWVAVRRMPYGPHLLSVGHNEERSRLSGVAVTRTRFITFVVSGLCCGVAATVYVATYRNVATTIGGALALEAIAAVVLGGTAITGGRCSLLGTVLGVVLLRMVQNGLLLVGIPSLWQQVVTGILLLCVLGIEAMKERIHLSRSASAARVRP